MPLPNAGSETMNERAAPAAGSSLDDLVEVMAILWPGARVTEGAGPGKSWLVLPNRRRPRLLVPASPRAARNAVRRHSAALTPAASLARAVAAFGAGALARLPVVDRVSLRSSAGGIDEFLSEAFGQEVMVALGIGKVRANRKPVLAVFDSDGRPLGFAKVGHTEVSSRHVSGEARNLEVVSSHTFRTFVHPQVVRFDTWNGMPVLVMTALRTPAWQGRNSRWNVPYEAIRELSEAIGSRESPLRELPFWRRAEELAAALRSDDVRKRVERCLRKTERRHGDTIVRSGAWHGDLTPWNIARSHGILQIWDWERFEVGVPAGLDAVHFVAQTYAWQHGFEVDRLLEGVIRASAGSHVGSNGHAAGAAYLMSVALRYLAASEEAGGEAILDRALVTLGAWEKALDIED